MSSGNLTAENAKNAKRMRTKAEILRTKDNKQAAMTTFQFLNFALFATFVVRFAFAYCEESPPPLMLCAVLR